MQLSHITLKNWKNFKSLDVDVGTRLFIVGANASGKSNFLDVLRFMRDIVKQGGGLQYAVSVRDGISKIRCLSARQDPIVKISFSLSDNTDIWTYTLGINQKHTGNHEIIVEEESVTKNNTVLLSRPNDEDNKDPEQLTQTYLEQINTNKDFREIAKFFEAVQYLHLVPQLLKYPEAFSGPDLPEDPFGKGFLRRIAQTPQKQRDSWLKKIESALKQATPHLENLSYKDISGQPHLEVIYTHWRAHGAQQQEAQLSDGTLRLIGLLWSLLDGSGLLLLEEPELSLHSAIVSKLAGMLYITSKDKRRQVFVTTHSQELLSDRGISLSQILVIRPGEEGSDGFIADSKKEIVKLLEGGMTPGESVLSETIPSDIQPGLGMQ